MHINWDNAPEWVTHYDDATGEFFSNKHYDLNCYSFPRPPKAETKNSKRPYNMPQAQRRSVYVDGDTWAALKEIGQGNASEGMRRAVKQYDHKILAAMEAEKGGEL